MAASLLLSPQLSLARLATASPLTGIRAFTSLVRCPQLSIPSSPAPLNPRRRAFSASARETSRPIPAREDLLVLGIETSCDDTAAAVVRGNGEILSQVVSSQGWRREMDHLGE